MLNEESPYGFKYMPVIDGYIIFSNHIIKYKDGKLDKEKFREEIFGQLEKIINELENEHDKNKDKGRP